jgi:hypothetical protein
MKNLGAIGALVLFAMWPAAHAAVPNPAVTGPVAATAIPGSQMHDYLFFASNHDLAGNGYVEEELFIQGTASRYNTPAQATGSVMDSDHPYKTRVVVRRPADPRRFNGTVLVEWYNVTNGFDAENMWFFAWEHMLRAGYVWVGVSAQQVGVAALKKFSAARYGTIDVNHAGTVNNDALSYDIFSQVGQAIRNPTGVDMLGGLKPRHVIAIGESQSASRLSTYVNSIHPLANIYGFSAFIVAEPKDSQRSENVCVESLSGVRPWDSARRMCGSRTPTCIAPGRSPARRMSIITCD